MRAKDLADIVLVSAVLYLLLVWLRLSLPAGVARRSMIAAPIAAAVYVLALSYDLYLLEQVLEGLLIVVLVGAVVVYQRDIRRMLDRAFTGRASDPPTSRIVDTLTEATATMAKLKMGGLIAIRGRESWDPHIQGGIELGGIVTPALLYSIFDPSTPGHDGAVLIENNRLSRFAAHLPLASDLPEVSRFGGTRHAAALGLSQECDALVIVVSEERGTITVAEDGRLTDALTAGEVRRRLLRFWHPRDGEAPAQSRRWWRSPNLQTACVSLGLATTLWMVLAYSPDTVLRSFAVPIALRNLPDDWTASDPVPAEARIDLIGSERSFQELDAENLTVSVDLSGPASGVREIVIGEDNLALPSGVELRRARPAAVTVRLQRTRTVQVPIVVPTIGVVAEPLELVSIQTEPSTVSVLVPEAAVDPNQVPTEALDLRQITGDAEIKSRLSLPADSHLPADASTEVVVRVRVDTRAKQEQE